MPAITFGTDGWRAVIADDFTFDNLATVTEATAQWLKRSHQTPSVLVGHDARFMGRAFAEHVARVLVACGAQVTLADGITTTPAISWATNVFDHDAGIVITASHNPPEYNGFKIKADFGGPATPAMIAEVERELDHLGDDPRMPPPFDHLVADGQITVRDVMADYLDMLREQLDVDAIRAAGLTVAHDAMFGAGQGVVRRLLGAEQVVELHSDVNPGFLGRPPEPIARNLEALSALIPERGCDVGLANDGDADRIGMFDEQGRFVTSHQILALLVKYLHEERGLSGRIVKTFSTTHMLDAMGTHYGLPVETVPIGFKYIAPLMAEGDVLVGGEESGGIAVMGHVPERDGIYIGLLVVEMMVKRGETLSALVQELFDQFGPHHYHRVDLHTTDAKKRAALEHLDREGGLDRLSGHAVTDVQTLDGFKHRTDHGWLLVRPSGTEPVLRIYAEAETPDAAQALVNDAIAQLGLD
ncbi:MAG: phosphoglucomutase/phosphomannomutase family protein [Bacteroidetes bacterium]|jgi:alpha-D-glucose phosphate-specific phosphoglucomutase|nr:phosphoglucomutase/phosphomannomutase family protein [Bacteroidota bacterium]